MYNLDQIKRIGLIHIGGGILALLVGIISESLQVNNSFTRALFNDLLTFIIFSTGWYLFNQLVMGQTFSSLKKGLSVGNKPVKTLKELPPLPRRFGLDYQAIEILAMVFALLLVGGLTTWIGENGGLSLGGFAGGWLIGGGLGRLRFVRKSLKEEQDQGRRFYFSDGTAGPRTELAYYETLPGPRTREQMEKASNPKPANSTLQEALPPGVKRRAGELQAKKAFTSGTPANPVSPSVKTKRKK